MEEDGRYMQVGVVSYGLGKCVTERNPPAAYTRITEFLDFIAIATADTWLIRFSCNVLQKMTKFKFWN